MYKFKNIKGFLIDLEGVIYSGDKIIEGAISTLEKLNSKFKIRYLTNTTTTSRKTIYRKLRNFQLPLIETDIFAPSMGRKIEREDEMNIKHLPYMNWVEWMNHLSQFKYAVHLMPTHAAGTFALNCAYHGITCIGYEGLDTQAHCHPQLTIKMNDLRNARKLANRLRTDSSFYETACETAKNNFNVFFGEKEYIYKMNKLLKEVINETN